MSGTCTKGDNVKEKCEQICKKQKQKLIIDLNVNDEVKKMEEIREISQSRLEDNEFSSILGVHRQILESGYPNYLGCQIPVKSGINVSFFRNNLEDYDDKGISDLLEFGAPVGFEGEFSKSSVVDINNHKGARDFEEDVWKYLRKEASYGAILGPFDQNPFSCNCKVSPLNTVAKKGTSERRVILDLSFPIGDSVNDFISKEIYLGEKINLTYPKVDDLVGIIKDKGKNCLVFKKDLKRAYRQIPLDPGDLHLVGFQFQGKLFVDRVLPMGLRSSSQICQRVTKAVVFMYLKMGFMAVNYLDDFGGAENAEHATEAYEKLGKLLEACGLEESKEKSVKPTSRMEFLGITVDTQKLTLEVTPERVEEISLLVESWLRKKKASLRDLQSLLGKLHFVATCVRPGRIFVSRLLNWLRQAFPSNHVGSGHRIFRSIPAEVHKDLEWWYKFLRQYNGVSIMFLENWSIPDEFLSCDSCLDGFGAICGKQFFHSKFPLSITNDHLHINCLELLVVIIAVKIWAKKFKGKRLMIICDNEASVTVINSGSTKDKYMQKCLRELCFISAVHEFEVRAKHISTEENRLADYLSRWHMDKRYSDEFSSLVKIRNYQEIFIQDSDFEFLNNW